jgi:hypothetical protein
VQVPGVWLATPSFFGFRCSKQRRICIVRDSVYHEQWGAYEFVKKGRSMNQIIPETQPDYDKTRIIERPDGFYWVHQDTTEEYGPFVSLLAAAQDMEYSDSSPPQTLVEDLHAAEAEIGINDWIDPDTGEPAEETFTHLEDH